MYCKKLSIKDVHGQGVVQCGRFADKDSSSVADVCIFWCKNLQIYSVSARTKGRWGLDSSDISRTRGKEGQFLPILCRHVLWTIPNVTR